MSEPTTAKRLAREASSRVRRERSAAELATARARLAVHVLARARGWHRVAAYEPLRTEPGSPELLDGLTALGIRLLVPVLRPDRDLDWVERGDPSALGVTAIADVDAVLVPALAVSRDGTRLGRGGGSYDRALARVPASATVAALLFDGELLDTLPAESWDVPVRAIVTPSGWLDLT